MPYKNLADRRANDKKYRAENAEKVKAQQTAWAARNPERIAAARKRERENLFADPERLERCRAAGREYWRATRAAALHHYGDLCECCGEHRPEFMAIDHVDGGGKEHRRQLAAQGKSIFLWLKENNYPYGFRLLCHNCNMARGFYGVCPHETERNAA